jgi:hypothetical protein
MTLTWRHLDRDFWEWRRLVVWAIWGCANGSIEREFEIEGKQNLKVISQVNSALIRTFSQEMAHLG